MKSYAQAGQDIWVHDLIGDSGYFVDVGAHDGIVHSNTYALEQLGWTGLCIEPNVEAYADLRQNRPGYVANMAVSDHFGHVDFDGVRVTAGAPSTACIPLADMLNLFRAPDTIDYLSVDVEGHELEVLAGMDFDHYSVRLLTVEHNLYVDGPVRKNAIAAFLSDRGFERVREDVVADGYGPYEDWWRNGKAA